MKARDDKTFSDRIADAIAGSLREPCGPAGISLAQAREVIARTEAEAARMGVRCVAAVSDASGHPIAIECVEGAFLGSFDIALNKCWTAAAFQMPTRTLAQLAAPGGSLYGIQFTNQGRVVIFGGGEPVFLDGRLIGAVGVSGGTAEEDTYLGAYAAKQAEEVTRWK